MKEFLEETAMLNFKDPKLQQLVTNMNGWTALMERELAKFMTLFAITKFGYNRSDDITASEVLTDGYGQCNTKSTLLMALLRGVEVPCRIHGFFIDKKMQKGALTGMAYFFAHQKIAHAWTEVYINDQWIVLEGVIIDDSYLQQVKNRLCSSDDGYIGYGIAVKDKENINLCWTCDSIYIQSFSITDDLGIFKNPDELFSKYNNTNGRLKKFLFNKKRKKINRKLDELRQK